MNRHLLIFLDKTVFQVLFRLIVFSAKRVMHQSLILDRAASAGKHFLVIRPGGIGDGLMSLPFLKTLHQNLPDTRVTLICLKKNKLAYKHVSCFYELIVLDTLEGLLRAAQLFWRQSIDVVFDLEPFRKVSSILSYFSRATVRVGFDTNDRRLLYTHLISYPNEKYYEAFNMIRQLGVLGLDIPEGEACDLTFALSDDEVEAAQLLLLSKNVDPEKNFIVAVVPGVLKNHHRWRMLYFSQLIHLMCQNDVRVKILLLGVANDSQDVQEVLGNVSETNKPVNFVGKTSYTESLALLRFCNILVACDGGIVYMAAAMGCSTVSIWGPGVMERFKPPGEKHIGIRKNYACVPCVNYSRLGEFPACPYNRKCINDISPEEVFEGYKSLKVQLESRHDHSCAVDVC